MRPVGSTKSAFDEFMIITAGWDFLHLTVDRFDWDDGSRRLFAVLMNGDMDFYGVEEVTAAFDGDIDALIPAILEMVDIDFVRYFAIVEQRDVLPEQWSWSDGETWSPPARHLKLAAAELGLHMISHVFVTVDEWNSTGPMHEFKSYLMGDELPTIAITRPARFVETRYSTVAQADAPPRALRLLE
jgi:hypothetical protein